VHDVYFDASGDSVLFARSNENNRELCIERGDIARRRVLKLACMKSDVIGSNLFRVSPKTVFGVIDVEDTHKHTAALRLFSLESGKQLRDVPDASSIFPPIDDRGAFAWGGIYPQKAHVTTTTGDRVVGEGVPLGWDGRGRLIVQTDQIFRPQQYPPPKLGAHPCGLIRAIAVDLP
jgi:hypothetical protein